MLKKALRPGGYLFSAFVVQTKVAKIPQFCNNRQLFCIVLQKMCKSGSRRRLVRNCLVSALSGNTRIIISVFVYLTFIRIDTSFNGKLEFAEPFADFTIRY